MSASHYTHLLGFPARHSWSFKNSNSKVTRKLLGALFTALFRFLFVWALLWSLLWLYLRNVWNKMAVKWRLRAKTEQKKKHNCDILSGARIRRAEKTWMDALTGRCYSLAYSQAKHTCCCCWWIKLILRQVQPSKITQHNTSLTAQSAILWKEHE